MRVSIDEVTIGTRFRKDMGDLQSLADSIAEVGLLQRIGVVARENPNRLEIVFGERRFRACTEILGMKEVDVVVLDIGKTLQKEHDENEIRKGFTTSERVAIGIAMEEDMAERRRLLARASNYLIGHGKVPDESDLDKVAELPPLKPGQKGRDLAAEKAGFPSTTNYRVAKNIVKNGTPELVEAMDSNVISINEAAKIAKQSPDDQKNLVQMDKKTRQSEFDRLIGTDEKAIAKAQDETGLTDCFEEIGKSPLNAGLFADEALPSERRIIMEAIPKVREFIAAFEGAYNGKIKAV